MSVLLVDIGNTRVKWARFANGRLQKQRAAAHAAWLADDFAALFLGGKLKIERVIVASVGGARPDRHLTAAARRVLGIRPQFVATTRALAGVRTTYAQPWRLGVDRFVAAIAAHQMAPRRPVCVIDVGTAMTIDIIDARGRHLGGAIVPGPRLMVGSLLHNTSGIRRRSGGRAGISGLFARDTRAAIEQGARYAAAAAADRAVAEARRGLKASPLVILTGGAAPAIHPLMQSAHSQVPDLVLRGLLALI